MQGRNRDRTRARPAAFSASLRAFGADVQSGSRSGEGSDIPLRRTILELLPRRAEGDDELPLYALLRRTRDESLDPKYRDRLRIAVLPYLHPRAFSRLTAKPFYMMTDAELEETRQAQLEHEKQVARGRGHLQVIKGPK
jgi:hypothetical protein